MTTAQENFSRVMISERMCLIGNPNFEAKAFKDLSPGDYVTSIGLSKKSATNKSGETSSSRIDHCDPPFEYAGRITLEHPFNDSKICNYIAFRIPEEHVSGWVNRQPEPVYMLYMVEKGEEEMYIVSGGGQTIRIYKTVFAKLETNPTNVSIAKWADGGAKLANYGPMCKDCAFRIQPDINNYLQTVEDALQCLLWEGVYNCHTREYENTGTTCKGFLYAKAFLTKKPISAIL